MDKISCDVCIDLMPLVKDEVASEESKEMVLEHIETCVSCKKLYGEEVMLRKEDSEMVKDLKNTVFRFFVGIMVLLVCVGITLTTNPIVYSNVILVPIIGGLCYKYLRMRAVYVGIFISVLMVFRNTLMLIHFEIGYDDTDIYEVVLSMIITVGVVYLLLFLAGICIMFLSGYGLSKKNAKKKKRKISSLVISGGLTIVTFWAAFQLGGNPITLYQIEKKADAYVEEHYKDLELEASISYDNFVGYVVHLFLDGEQELWFRLVYDDSGELLQDNYHADLFGQKFSEYYDAVENISTELSNNELFDEYEAVEILGLLDADLISEDDQEVVDWSEVDWSQYNLTYETTIEELAQDMGIIALNLTDENAVFDITQSADIIRKVKSRLDDAQLEFVEFSIGIKNDGYTVYNFTAEEVGSENLEEILKTKTPKIFE